jgi:hypothetical protein
VKKLTTAIGVIGLLLLGVSIVQYFMVLTSPSFGQLWRAERTWATLQQRVHVSFKVTDQYGQPASAFKARVILTGVRWYYRVFPLFGLRHACYTIETDVQGRAVLRPWLTKAFNLRMRQIDVALYECPMGSEPKPNIDSEFTLDPSNKGKVEVSLQVLRHGPPVQLKTLYVKYPDRPDAFHLQLQDEHLVGFDFEEHLGSPGENVGSLIVTVKNARAAAESYWKQHGESDYSKWTEHPTWTVAIEGKDGLELQRKKTSYVADAPQEGYENKVEYNIPIENGGSAYFSQAVYSRSRKPKRYAVLKVRAELLSDGYLLLSVQGFENEHGDINLYQGPHIDEQTLEANRRSCK